jgi:hypothetical protein
MGDQTVIRPDMRIRGPRMGDLQIVLDFETDPPTKLIMPTPDAIEAIDRDPKRYCFHDHGDGVPGAPKHPGEAPR